ncbi:hypothetical protein SAMN04488128_1011155 [Chitinophaga eiseniae]|uniref:Uncharacterized protein n=1 Tax=Chitinophaga eiseniae TaxID=634771 RepID=A0A1T4MKZ4_9BACT|nr:hypothetical protein SAMN04488128_1011155 [Chitinophaga eiseniae]
MMISKTIPDHRRGQLLYSPTAIFTVPDFRTKTHPVILLHTPGRRFLPGSFFQGVAEPFDTIHQAAYLHISIRQRIAALQDYQYFRKTRQGAYDRTRRDVPLLHNGISPHASKVGSGIPPNSSELGISSRKEQDTYGHQGKKMD